MATDGVILVRNRVFAGNIETTTGTPIALTGTDGVFNVFSPDFKSEIPPSERMGQGSLTRLAPIPGARMGKFSFKTELYNAVTVPFIWSRLLLACGFQVTAGVYTPLTSMLSTLTLGMYQGDSSRFKSIAGAMGNLKIVGETGKPAMMEWEFTGKHIAPATATKIAPTYPTTVPARVAGITLTIGGVGTYRAGKFELDLGNKVVMRQDMTDVTGYRAATITDRKPVFKIPIESLPLATHDFWADHLASTTAALSIVIGSGLGGTVTIAATNLQFINPPQDEDRDGINLDSLEFVCTSTTADSELSLTLS